MEVSEPGLGPRTLLPNKGGQGQNLRPEGSRVAKPSFIKMQARDTGVTN